MPFTVFSPFFRSLFILYNSNYLFDMSFAEDDMNDNAAKSFSAISEVET